MGSIKTNVTLNPLTLELVHTDLFGEGKHVKCDLKNISGSADYLTQENEVLLQNKRDATDSIIQSNQAVAAPLGQSARCIRVKTGRNYIDKEVTTVDTP